MKTIKLKSILAIVAISISGILTITGCSPSSPDHVDNEGYVNNLRVRNSDFDSRNARSFESFRDAQRVEESSIVADQQGGINTLTAEQAELFENFLSWATPTTDDESEDTSEGENESSDGNTGSAESASESEGEDYVVSLSLDSMKFVNVTPMDDQGQVIGVELEDEDNGDTGYDHSGEYLFENNVQLSDGRKLLYNRHDLDETKTSKAVTVLLLDQNYEAHKNNLIRAEVALTSREALNEYLEPKDEEGEEEERKWKANTALQARFMVNFGKVENVTANLLPWENGSVPEDANVIACTLPTEQQSGDVAPPQTSADQQSDVVPALPADALSLCSASNALSNATVRVHMAQIIWFAPEQIDAWKQSLAPGEGTTEDVVTTPTQGAMFFQGPTTDEASDQSANQADSVDTSAPADPVVATDNVPADTNIAEYLSYSGHLSLEVNTDNSDQGPAKSLHFQSDNRDEFRRSLEQPEPADSDFLSALIEEAPDSTDTWTTRELHDRRLTLGVDIVVGNYVMQLALEGLEYVSNLTPVADDEAPAPAPEAPATEAPATDTPTADATDAPTADAPPADATDEAPAPAPDAPPADATDATAEPTTAEPTTAEPTPAIPPFTKAGNKEAEPTTPAAPTEAPATDPAPEATDPAPDATDPAPEAPAPAPAPEATDPAPDATDPAPEAPAPAPATEDTNDNNEPPATNNTVTNDDSIV